MKRNRLFVGAVIALLLATSVSTPIQTIDAADNSATVTATNQTNTNYITSEKETVMAYQKQYADLTAGDTETPDYTETPVFADTFNPGVLAPSTINQSVAWINYYRSLSGLPAITSYGDSNTLAQISSAVMADAESDPYKDQHGLTNTTKPIGLPDLYWNRAIFGTASSNLYFGFPKSISSPIRELMIDNTNISGMDAGHRAWFLSPFLSTVGVGIAKATAGRTYESVLVKNGADQYRAPAAATVNYPGDGLFPVEELTADSGTTQIPWSITFSQLKDIVTDSSTITVTNLTDGTTGTVSPSSFGSAAYASTVLSFLPPANVTINDHSQYQVAVSGLNSDNMPSYTYTFKTFSEKGNGVPGNTSDEVATEQSTTNSN
ncbi:CAP domain-containing protein [Companilactobacillus ginsenosidimutans]|uniref:SCP domain-containing protein n=1 Tax=Companilactobacillus ginsenosidimutans TaxID=1007676 RepID=A0A0H4QMU5_9LACO|nr:CAP domain-containing protein [Companilactobacillus ginsenosidimutans]AKP68033.1 hypothetical protein ABM34_11145 [Companilactobacillus ginsenosidimutans]